MLGEPTNDLDVDTLTALEDLLDGWPGTLLVVSHDRYLLERVTDDQLAVLGDGTLRHLPGGVGQYLELRKHQLAASAGAGAAGSATASATTAPAAGGTAKAGSAEQREARKTLARIERRLEALAVQEKKLHGDLATHASDFEKVRELNKQLRGIEAERDDLEEQWMAAAELTAD
ncbi:ATP-binding cassette domain-containing protein [Cumulibacter manganitolerans]|uniref:hypothetical protein n=1 Tax=Cumulibacter manganitolerans TaxID=1884992 RepID=UPI001296FB62|nr:hypothetical protein [Cumulibacter manganitolerans]